MTGPSTSPAANGQEGRVSEEMVSAGHAAMRRHWRETGGSYTWDQLVRAVLAAVAPDIAAQAKRECAEELDTVTREAFEAGAISGSFANRLLDVIGRWSGSGRTPADEGDDP